MRCVSLKGESASFVLMSEFFLLLQTHWYNGRSYVCPGCVDGECEVCRHSRPRMTGYCATSRQDPGQLLVREICLLEVAGELAELIDSLPAAERKGCWIDVRRTSVRRPWQVVRYGRVNVVTVVEDREVVEAVGRLYGLPALVDGPRDDFASRFGAAVAYRMSAAIGASVGA